MADDIKTDSNPLDEAAKLAEANAEVARKQAAQDVSGQSTRPDIDTDTGGALDALAKSIETKEPDETAPPAVKTPEEEAKEKADAEAKTKADAAASEDKARSEKLFEGQPQLPQGASPKSHEAFAAIKVKAAQDILARDKQIEDMKKQLAERDERLKNPVPKELTDEVTELRQFRAKFDVEADPKFKEFDKQVSQAHDFVYAQLAKHSAITPDVIEAIKKHGGPENVKMDKIFDAIKDPATQRLVEIKLTEIETAKFNKQEAIKAAKQNVDGYLKERATQFENASKSHNEATGKELDGILGQPVFSWMAERTPGEKADDAAKAATEDHNKFVKGIQESLQAARADDSPGMRAILLAGMAQLLWTQRAYATIKDRNAVLEKSTAELTEKLARFKSAGRLKSDESSASPSVQKAAPKPIDVYTRPGDALDAIRDQVLAEQAKAR